MNPYENLADVLSALADNAKKKSLQEARTRTSRQQYAAEALAYEHALELLRMAIRSDRSESLGAEGHP